MRSPTSWSLVSSSFVSVWRCYYLPPTSRDALSGPEAIAEYAVREHTMINSFFRIDLWSTNNQFKSPFLISLQIICKMAGFQFGQVWLSVLFVSFTVFLYHALKERVHPLFAGLLLLLFLMTPEMYAYTFMILYDYSNMVFFFLSLFFLFDFFRTRIPGHFYFAGLLMGIATYIRAETLVLAFLFLPVLLVVQIRDRDAVKKIVLKNFLFFLPSLLGYFLPNQLYINYYLPAHYDIGGLMNTHFSNLHPLFQRYGDIVTRLLAGEFGIHLWGYIFYLAAVLFLCECVFVRRFGRDARNWLYAIAVVYIGLGALGYVLPMMNLTETTKRALFKLLPLVLLYLADNGLVIRLSQGVSRWEAAPPGLTDAAKRSAAAATTAAANRSTTAANAAANASTTTNASTATNAAPKGKAPGQEGKAPGLQGKTPGQPPNADKMGTKGGAGKTKPGTGNTKSGTGKKKNRG